jgi:hypothetical protein
VGTLTSTHLASCDSYAVNLLPRVIAAWQAGKPFAAGECLWFRIQERSRRPPLGHLLTPPGLMARFRALADGVDIHRQRISRWGKVTDFHFMAASS